MVQYILKRLLIFFPALAVISLLTFIISVNTPGDPVESLISGQSDLGMSERAISRQAYEAKRKELGLNLPVFYFSIATMAATDTLYKIPRQLHRKSLKRLTFKYGNWENISDFYLAVKSFENQLYNENRDSTVANALIDLRQQVSMLFRQHDPDRIEYFLTAIKEKVAELSSLQYLNPFIQNVDESFRSMGDNSSRWKVFVPSFHWHGTDNQYHWWLFGRNQYSDGILKGDFGISYQTKRPVFMEIKEAILITLNLSIGAILLSYLIAIPLGIFSASRKGTFSDKAISTGFFILYSLPAFWIGTLLIIFLANPDFLHLFPTYGLGEIPAGASWWEKLLIRAHHLLLPLVCLVYPTLAFLSRQARGSILNVLHQDYIQTARAKGLPEGKVVWKHAFRNALLPVITMLSNVFPYAIAGSVVVEVVFSIPGMGKLTLDALYARNYPVVYSIILLSAVMTMIGYLVADVLYAMADPRISYHSKSRG